jgi:hypothetical protein
MHERALKRVVPFAHLEEEALVQHEVAPIGPDEGRDRLQLRVRGGDALPFAVVNEVKATDSLTLQEVYEFLRG